MIAGPRFTLKLITALVVTASSTLTPVVAAGNGARGAKEPEAAGHAYSASASDGGRKTRAAGTPLLRYPAIHGNQIVFEAGGQLWTSTLAGGQAR